MIEFRCTGAVIVPIEQLVANDYNPNRMPDIEMELLMNCIKTFGFLFPILVVPDGDRYRIVDGYHRFEALKRLGSDKAAILVLDLPLHEAVQLTILMNRIKGMHQVQGMAGIVVKLTDLGLEDEEICRNLGMEIEEYVRLKQQLGIAHAYRHSEYSRSWTLDNGV